MHAPHKLIEQLQRVADQANATGAAVFLPSPWEPVAHALLLHVGPEPPLEELASQDAAEAFAAEVAESGEWAGRPAALDGIVTSRLGDGVLIPVPLLTSLWAGVSPPGAASLRRRKSDGRGPNSTAGWVGLRLALDQAGAPAARTNVQLAHSLASTVVSLYGLLTDPLTGLPGRNELHGALRLDLFRARRRRLPCALLLVNPIGLEWVNAHHGRRAGDAVVREVVQRLQSLLRRSDVLMRYGGAISHCRSAMAIAPARCWSPNGFAATSPGARSSTTRCRCAARWGWWQPRPPTPRRWNRWICSAGRMKRWPPRGSRAARPSWSGATTPPAPMPRPPIASSASSPGAPTRTTATWVCSGTCCGSCRRPAGPRSWPSMSSSGCGRYCGPIASGCS